jgi:hypothetical protein
MELALVFVQSIDVLGPQSGQRGGAVEAQGQVFGLRRERALAPDAHRDGGPARHSRRA